MFRLRGELEGLATKPKWAAEFNFVAIAFHT